MSTKLRDLIRAVRSAKTAAEERSVIMKECAAIRAAIKEGKEHWRARYVSKLMYIHLLGYPTEFGQMECIRLLTSESFEEKRIGYIALSLLLDERHEVMTLVEHSMKKDLGSRQEHVQGLVLCCIANTAGEDMARDLSNEVAGLLDHGNPNIAKKACLAGLRIVRKVPTMARTFLDRLTHIMSQKNNGVVLAALALINEALVTPDGEECLLTYRKIVPDAVVMLKSLVMSSYPKNDVQGIADPFLQVKLLQFLRIVGKDSQRASEQMNDILAQVSTNTEARDNKPGCAILYECVNTIIGIESEPGLRVLGVNILGRFLVNRDNNIRYVALNTLTKVVEKDVQAVQRHKDTIVDCLRDVDISIRKRALDLIYNLVNPTNIRLLVPDLINYHLGLASAELKQDLTAKICLVAERFAPNPQWHIDTLIRVLTISDSQVPERAYHKLLALISQADVPLQQHAVDKLFHEVSGPIDVTLLQKEPLLICGVWSIGELGEVLMQKYQQEGKHFEVESFVTVITGILQNTGSNIVKQYCLNALLKVAARFPIVKILVTPTFEAYQAAPELELQQRAWEYLQILSCGDDNMAVAVAERMPGLETTSVVPEEHIDLQGTSPGQSPVTAVPQGHKETETATHVDPTGFLDSMFGGTPMTMDTTGGLEPAQEPAKQGGLNLDDLFGGSSPPPQQPSQPPSTTDFFDSVMGQSTPQPQQPPQSQQSVLSTFQAYKSNEVVIEYVISRPDSSKRFEISVDAVIYNVSGSAITGTNFMAAVTRSARVNMKELPQNSIPPGGKIVQGMVVIDDSQGAKAVAMKVKLAYTVGGKQMNHDFVVNSFPSL